MVKSFMTVADRPKSKMVKKKKYSFSEIIVHRICCTDVPIISLPTTVATTVL